MNQGASAATCHFQGLPCIELSLAQGDRVRIALHGAHVLSWTTADAQERLYLSPRAHTDGVHPIRGGVPLCFPQFNERALGGNPLPKHGFARTLAWTPQDLQQSAAWSEARLGLCSNAQTLALWPHAFAATLTVRLESGCLRMAFEVHNTGSAAWPFALALHTYLHTDDIARTQLRGLEGLRYWDAVQHLAQPEVRLTQPESPLTFFAETDRVYADAQAPLTVHHPGGAVCLTQSASLPDVVVWNPAAERCAALNDMPPGGWRDMLCVEAARINAPVLLSPGQSWSGWQQLCVLPGP
jgi:glucose-6-phosphate 1-epimerase